MRIFYEGGGVPICSMDCWLSSPKRMLTRDECFKNFSQHFETHCKMGKGVLVSAHHPSIFARKKLLSKGRLQASSLRS